MSTRTRPERAKNRAASGAAAIAVLLALALATPALASCRAANDQAPHANSSPLSGADAQSEAVLASSADSAAVVPEPGGDYPVSPYRSEGYQALDEPGFVSTATRPLSTLSADADTASYANVRRMVLREGASPSDIPAGAVRTEEMLNYFDYRYGAPAGDDLFGVMATLSACPWNPDTKLLVMGFATQPAERLSTAGSNLVFLIDVSGSMADADKLPLLQDAFAQLVDGLDEKDRVSIVTYSGSERVALEGASGADKRTILRAIDGLEAGGSTNGEAGLQTAYRLAEELFIEGGTNRIVMASDGDLNVGISEEDELHDFVDEKRDTDVYLSVLGFGTGNYQDAKMETLADHGNGSYHYIDCIEEAQRVFGKNLQANLTPLADDVKLQVEFNPALVKGWRLIGYENRALADEDFRDDAADAGEIGTGHAFTVAYEVVPAGSAFEVPETELKYGADGSRGTDASSAADDEAAGDAARTGDATEWLTCTMRYRPSGQTDAVEQAHVVDSAALTDDPSADWRFAAAVIECSMLLRESDHAGTSTYESALELAGSSDVREREEFGRLLKSLARRA